ncbi:hypothetical protein [Dyadobacter sp. NIV53]|uniref:hypothetical protein n=1 Tax=Dyadobacter sp. NIV53 TaxID=2861765 RepID=UPI001C887B4E|nr:hypothetical protein [Dyadobacter sp. NIV53]
MEKDKTITNFLDRLNLKNSTFSLEVVDFWESDNCAIGLKKENKLIYISTFNFFDKTPIKYDFDLELIIPMLMNIK